MNSDELSPLSAPASPPAQPDSAAGPEVAAQPEVAAAPEVAAGPEVATRPEVAAQQVANGQKTDRGRHRSTAQVRRRRVRRRQRVVVVLLVAVVAGITWIAIPGRSTPTRHDSTPPPTTAVKAQPVYLPAVVSLVRELTKFPGTPPALPFPASGQSAVYVGGVGLLGSTPDEQEVPIVSVTKVMTAIIILHDHPLGRGNGPIFTMTAADNAAYYHDATNDDSNLYVVKGEHLTERQLLEALMIPSADNIADYLARWDAGSIPAFVRKMNAVAKSLGLTDTHYADASGLNPQSRSTAVDQARLGAYAMRVPGMISVEDHPTMTFPAGGRVGNYNPVVGVDGVIGLKSGFTSASQGCLVTAAWRKVGGHRVLVVSSSLSQPVNLPQVGQIDLQLLDAATSSLEVRPVAAEGKPVAAVVAAWTSTRQDVVLRGEPPTVVGWAGLAVKTVVRASISHSRGVQHGWQPGWRMAVLEVATPGGVQCVAPAVLEKPFPPAPPGWAPSSSHVSASTTSSTGG